MCKPMAPSKKLVVDIDKTVSKSNLGRKVYPGVCEKLKEMSESGVQVEYATGRTTPFRAYTERMLVAAGCPNPHDIVLRESLLDDYYVFKGNVFREKCGEAECIVVDDNDRVLEIAMDMGIKTHKITREDDWKSIDELANK